MIPILIFVFLAMPSIITLLASKISGSPLIFETDPKTISLNLLFSLLPFWLLYSIFGILVYLLQLCFSFDLKLDLTRPIYWLLIKEYLPASTGILRWGVYIFFLYFAQLFMLNSIFKWFNKTLINGPSSSKVLTILSKLDILDTFKIILQSKKEITIDLKMGNFIYSGFYDRLLQSWNGKKGLSLKNVYKIEVNNANDTIQNLISEKKIKPNSYLPEMYFDFDKVENINFQVSEIARTEKFQDENLKAILIEKIEKGLNT